MDEEKNLKDLNTKGEIQVPNSKRFMQSLLYLRNRYFISRVFQDDRKENIYIYIQLKYRQRYEKVSTKSINTKYE